VTEVTAVLASSQECHYLLLPTHSLTPSLPSTPRNKKMDAEMVSPLLHLSCVEHLFQQWEVNV
jgi:hypothetical protein